MAFDPYASPQDYFELDGQKSPGLATITNTKALREWKERGGFGVSGGFTVFSKVKNARPVVKIRLYPGDWAAWHEWKPLVLRVPTRRGGDKPESGYLRIAHPILEDLGITAVGVESVSQPEQVEDGVWEVTIEFLQFVAPKVTLAKPDATKPKPIDPYEAQIAALRAENRNLMDDLGRRR